MGIWGCGLYQDDVTCDVKSNYLNWLRVGKTNKEATELMLEYYEDYIDDEDDAPPFWFALADTQWTVSYTHLDVYKRQSIFSINESNITWCNRRTNRMSNGNSRTSRTRYEIRN